MPYTGAAARDRRSDARSALRDISGPEDAVALLLASLPWARTPKGRPADMGCAEWEEARRDEARLQSVVKEVRRLASAYRAHRRNVAQWAIRDDVRHSRDAAQVACAQVGVEFVGDLAAPWSPDGATGLDVLDAIRRGAYSDTWAVGSPIVPEARN